MKTRILVLILALVMVLALGVMTACGAQGEKGDKGDKGDTGANGANGVGIADVKIEDGKLVIVYTDDKTTELDLPSADVAAACDHENVTYGELANAPHSYDAKNNVFTDGKYVVVCEDCGNAEITEGVYHTYTTQNIAAVCLKKAYTVEKCLCGYEDADTVKEYGDVKEHNWVVGYTVYGSNNDVANSVCVKGGATFDICKDCNAKEINYHDKGIGHEVTAVIGSVTNNQVTGTCNRCLCNLTITLPSTDTSKVYGTKLDKEITDCMDRDGITATYTTYISTSWDVKTLTDKAAAGLVKIEFTKKLDNLTGHYLGNLFVADGDVIPYNTDGVKEMSNAKSNCGNGDGVLETGMGRFVCTACSADVYVETKRAHEWTNITWDDGKAPTCYFVGSGEATCKVCEFKNEDYALEETLDHDLEATLNGNVITFVCLANGCNDPIPSVTVADPSTLVITKSTCVTKGTISYVDAAGETVVHNLPLTLHTLNGKAINDQEKQFVVSGIKEGKNTTATCTKDGIGTFVCDVCAESLMVTTKKDHNYDSETKITWTDANGDPVEGPNCVAEVTKNFKCKDCDVISLVVPAIDHEYGYTLSADRKTVNVGCVNGCGDVTPYEVEKLDIIKDASCTAKGKANVTFNDGEVKAVDLAITAHKLNDKFMPDDVAYDIDTVGLKNFKNSIGSCNKLGAGSFICEVCGDEIIVDTNDDHKFAAVDAEDKVAATCEERGYTDGTCVNCGKEERAYVPALGHNYGDPVYSNGKVTLSCKTCAAVDKAHAADATKPECECDDSVLSFYHEDALAEKRFDVNKVTVTPTCKTSGVQHFEIHGAEIRDYSADVYEDNGDLKTPGVKKIDIKYDVTLIPTEHAPALDNEGNRVEADLKWHQVVVTVDDNGTADKSDDKEVKTTYDCTGFICKDCGHIIVETNVVCEATLENGEAEDCLLVEKKD